MLQNMSELSGWILSGISFGLLCVALVVSRNKVKKAERLAFVDTVTEGMTENAFQAQTKQAFAKNNTAFAFVSMQVENMQQICSSCGLAQREHILKYLYHVLKEQLSGEELVTRTGEDAFCFILKNRKKDEIYARLDRIWDTANQFNKKDTDTFCLHLCFGIYLPQPGENDVNVMQDKSVLARLGGEKGKRYHFYDPERWENNGWEREMADSLDHALKTNELVVYYQPIVRVLDQRIVGAEALIRWRHPQRGLLSSDMFLPLAKQKQKSYKIDRFVFIEVCRALNRWAKQGRELCPISVNLARANLEHPNFADECFEICSQYNVDPSLIEFEIKEELLLENPERIKSMLERFHALGFRCAVDNFGADLTSMQILSNVDIDTLKLDQSFFSGENDNRRGRYVAEAILKLATRLHIRTVAEGVDNPGQVQYLQQLACDMIQGFYYYKPMPLEKFENEVYVKDTLKFVDKKTETPNERAVKKHMAIGQTVQIAKSIVLFSYLPDEDIVEFSDVFSPVLGNQKKFQNALALFRTTDLIHENDKEDFFRMLERCQREDGWVENTLRFYIADGRYGWLEMHVHQDKHDAGRIISGTMLNVAEWNNEVNRWKEKAIRDALTGLYNREHFEHSVQTQLEQKIFSSAAVLFIDVDDFKRVNDTLGHMFGDDVLCYVAKLILGVFRHTDVIARYGGDEFVVFAPSIQRSVLEDRLKQLCGAFKFPYRSETIEYKVSVTIGAAMFPQDGADYETLLEHADCALYEAKSRGKDQYVLYEPNMQGKAVSDHQADEVAIG